MPIYRKELLELETPVRSIVMLWNKRTDRIITFTDQDELDLTRDDRKLITSGRWSRIKRIVTPLEWAILQRGSPKLVDGIIVDTDGMISDGG